MNKLSNRTHIHFAPFQLGPFRHNSEQVENVLNVLYDLAYLPNVLRLLAALRKKRGGGLRPWMKPWKVLWDTFSLCHFFPGTFNTQRSHISVKFHFTDLAPCRPSRAAGPSKRTNRLFSIVKRIKKKVTQVFVHTRMLYARKKYYIFPRRPCLKYLVIT